MIYYTGEGASAAKQIFLNPTDKVQSTTDNKKYISCPNVKVSFKNNSIYNFKSFWIGVKNPKQINLEHNVADAELSGNCYMVSINESGYGAMSTETCTAKYNYLRNSLSTNDYAYTDMTTTVRAYFTRASLTQAKAKNSDPSPFLSVNTTTGYLPVNTTVVTTGAGATYTTKLWKTWE